MIRFYPRDIGCWRDMKYNFVNMVNGEFTNSKERVHRDFRDMHGLVAFFKDETAVRIDDVEYPLEIYQDTDKLHTVKQWTVIGWIEYI